MVSEWLAVQTGTARGDALHSRRLRRMQTKVLARSTPTAKSPTETRRHNTTAVDLTLRQLCIPIMAQAVANDADRGHQSSATLLRTTIAQ